jgi:hypothetical protein
VALDIGRHRCRHPINNVSKVYRKYIARLAVCLEIVVGITLILLPRFACQLLFAVCCHSASPNYQSNSPAEFARVEVLPLPLRSLTAMGAPGGSINRLASPGGLRARSAVRREILEVSGAWDLLTRTLKKFRTTLGQCTHLVAHVSMVASRIIEGVLLPCNAWLRRGKRTRVCLTGRFNHGR